MEAGPWVERNGRSPGRGLRARSRKRVGWRAGEQRAQQVFSLGVRRGLWRWKDVPGECGVWLGSGGG